MLLEHYRLEQTKVASWEKKEERQTCPRSGKRKWRLPQRRRRSVIQFAVSHYHRHTVWLPVGLRLLLVLRSTAGSLEAFQLQGRVADGGGEAHLLHANSDFLQSGIARGRVALTRPVVTDYMRE